jgi:hypothetical protein
MVVSIWFESTIGVGLLWFRAVAEADMGGDGFEVAF